MNTLNYIFNGTYYIIYLISRNSRNRSILCIFGYFIPLEALSLAEFTVVAGIPSVVRLRIEEAFAISGLFRYRLACLHDFAIFSIFYVVMLSSLNLRNSGDVFSF